MASQIRNGVIESRIIWLKSGWSVSYQTIAKRSELIKEKMSSNTEHGKKSLDSREQELTYSLARTLSQVNWTCDLQYTHSRFRFLKEGSVQLLRRVWLFVTRWTAAHQASLSFTISWSLLKLMHIELVMPSNHLILCHPFLLLPSTLQHQCLFQWVSSSHQVAKVVELQLQHQSFQWTPRTDLL